MPRNDQIIRQWHLLRELESPRGKTLKELVNALPRDDPRHERTVRRDLEVLEASGIPLITEKVYGHVRWRFMDGYRNNLALGFSPSEILALRLTRQLLTPLEGTGIQESLQSALAKAEAGVPNPEGKTPPHLPAVFAFTPGSHKSYKSHQTTIATLAKATGKLHTVQMRYFSATRNQTTRREVSPYRLWYSQGALYLIGYCHFRKDVRMFAVERIKSVTPTDHPFQMPLDFDLEDYVKDAIGIMRGQPIKVELRFNKPTSRLGQRPHLASHTNRDPAQKRRTEHDPHRRRQSRTRRMDLKLWQRGEGDRTRLTSRSRPSGSQGHCRPTRRKQKPPSKCCTQKKAPHVMTSSGR